MAITLPPTAGNVGIDAQLQRAIQEATDPSTGRVDYAKVLRLFAQTAFGGDSAAATAWINRSTDPDPVPGAEAGQGQGSGQNVPAFQDGMYGNLPGKLPYPFMTDRPYGQWTDQLKEIGASGLTESLRGRNQIYDSYTAADPTLGSLNPLMQGFVSDLNYPTRASFFLNAMNDPNLNFRDYLTEQGPSQVGDIDFGQFRDAWRTGKLPETVTQQLRNDPDLVRNLINQVGSAEVNPMFRSSARDLISKRMAAMGHEYPGMSPYEMVVNRGSWNFFQPGEAPPFLRGPDVSQNIDVTGSGQGATVPGQGATVPGQGATVPGQGPTGPTVPGLQGQPSGIGDPSRIGEDVIPDPPRLPGPVVPGPTGRDRHGVEEPPDTYEPPAISNIDKAQAAKLFFAKKISREDLNAFLSGDLTLEELRGRIIPGPGEGTVAPRGPFDEGPYGNVPGEGPDIGIPQPLVVPPKLPFSEGPYGNTPGMVMEPPDTHLSGRGPLRPSFLDSPDRPGVMEPDDMFNPNQFLGPQRPPFLGSPDRPGVMEPEDIAVTGPQLFNSPGPRPFNPGEFRGTPDKHYPFEPDDMFSPDQVMGPRPPFLGSPDRPGVMEPPDMYRRPPPVMGPQRPPFLNSPDRPGVMEPPDMFNPNQFLPRPQPPRRRPSPQIPSWLPPGEEMFI